MPTARRECRQKERAWEQEGGFWGGVAEKGDRRTSLGRRTDPWLRSKQSVSAFEPHLCAPASLQLQLHHRPGPPSLLLASAAAAARRPVSAGERTRLVPSALSLSLPAPVSASQPACLLPHSLGRVANGASRRQRRSSGPRPPVAHAVPLLGRLATLLEALSKKRGATNKGPTPGPARKRTMLANLKRCLQTACECLLSIAALPHPDWPPAARYSEPAITRLRRTASPLVARPVHCPPMLLRTWSWPLARTSCLWHSALAANCLRTSLTIAPISLIHDANLAQSPLPRNRHPARPVRLSCPYP